MRKPRIAILMDENTSGDGTRYEATKTYFSAITDAGGIPFGVPYLAQVIDAVVQEFDGLLTVGGRFAYPDDWYIGDGVALTPGSDRFEIEKEIVGQYLALDKPVLGLCAGMQMLACLHGCKMTPDLKVTYPDAIEHDKAGQIHPVSILPGSVLAQSVGGTSLDVNSYHREAIVELTEAVIASATASDGVIEAIELPAYKFAIGLQWHQEKFAGTDHRGNRLFRGLIEAC